MTDPKDALTQAAEMAAQTPPEQAQEKSSTLTNVVDGLDVGTNVIDGALDIAGDAVVAVAKGVGEVASEAGGLVVDAVTSIFDIF